MTIPRQIHRIAVIGAGPSGLAAAKYLLAEKCFDKIDIFEQRRSVGGVWNYSPAAYKTSATTSVPQLSPNDPTAEQPVWRSVEQAEKTEELVFLSPLYERLETNIPKELMRFSDLPFPADQQLFPKHGTVLNYLEAYAEDVKNLVHLATQVIDLRPKGHRTGPWVLTVKRLLSNRESTEVYDAVVVATGHYNVPYLPDIEGIREWNIAYPGVISHSKFYDSSEAFRDKKVVVVGSSASGTDIGAQISETCKGQLIVSQRSESFLSASHASKKREHPEIVAFLPPGRNDRAIQFADGTVEKEIDAIVFCTGYFYSYPFLSSLEPPVITDGGRVRNVYQQLFYAPNPTLVFPVLPQRIIPFPMSENQAAVFARVWSGRLTLPPQAVMKASENLTVAEKGDGKAFHLLPFPMDADYLNYLYDWAAKSQRRPSLENDGIGKIGTRWEERERWWRQLFPEIRRAFLAKGEHRSEIKSLAQLGFDFDQWKAVQRSSCSASHA